MHAEVCESSVVEKLKGENGSCRIVISPKKLVKQGSCTGNLGGDLPCTLIFASDKDGATMNINCGKNPQIPDINQEMDAEALGYTVATLIKKSDGQDLIINDKNNYSFFANRMIRIFLVESPAVFGKTKTSADITISLDQGKVGLTNVVCQ